MVIAELHYPDDVVVFVPYDLGMRNLYKTL